MYVCDCDIQGQIPDLILICLVTPLPRYKRALKISLTETADMKQFPFSPCSLLQTPNYRQQRSLKIAPESCSLRGFDKLYNIFIAYLIFEKKINKLWNYEIVIHYKKIYFAAILLNKNCFDNSIHLLCFDSTPVNLKDCLSPQLIDRS